MTTFYVIPQTGGGTPTGDGSAGDPWNGLANVLYNGSPGVEVNAGDTLVCTGDFAEESLTVGHSGVVGSPITFDLLNATITRSNGSCISTQNRNYLVFNGGVIGGLPSSSSRDVFVRNSDSIVFNFTEFLDSSNDRSIEITIDSSGFCNDITFNRCVINNLLTPRMSAGTSSILNGLNVEDCKFAGSGGYIQFFWHDQVLSLVTNDFRAERIKVNRNTFLEPRAPAFACIGLGGSTRNEFLHNTIIGSGKGGTSTNINAVQTGFTKNLIIGFNTITETSTKGVGDGHCIILDHIFDGAIFHPSDDIEVVGNYCTTSVDSEATGRMGINVWVATNCRIHGNICENNIWGMQLSNPESTGNIFGNNTCINNESGGMHLSANAVASTVINNIFSGGARGISGDTGTIVPTESYNTFYNHSEGSIYSAGVPIAIDSTDIEATVNPIDTNNVPIKDGDACGNAANWWVALGLPNPRGFNGNPFSDTLGTTDRGAIQSELNPLHPGYRG